jgi:hypothetical protein
MVKDKPYIIDPFLTIEGRQNVKYYTVTEKLEQMIEDEIVPEENLWAVRKLVHQLGKDFDFVIDYTGNDIETLGATKNYKRIDLDQPPLSGPDWV